MKFSTKEDLEIPVETAFNYLTDFAVYERAVKLRGAEIARQFDDPAPREGLEWKAKFTFRGKQRKMDIRLSKCEPQKLLQFSGTSPSVISEFVIELVQLAPARTRMHVELDIKPRSLAARLMIQSARLARSKLNRRFKNRIADFADDLEQRHKKGAASSGSEIA